jgi:hypothetical protein
MQGDGRSLALRDTSFDLVVFHTTCATYPIPTRRSKKPIASFALADG